MAANSKLIAINVGLATALVLIAWQGRVRWQEAQAQREGHRDEVVVVDDEDVGGGDRRASVGRDGHFGENLS